MTLDSTCSRCWNKYIEECGCDGKPIPEVIVNWDTDFCCSSGCSVKPSVKVEGVPCDICLNEGFCNCRCVYYRLSRYNPTEYLNEGGVYRVVHMERKLVDAPLFYDHLLVRKQYRYTPFYYLILTFHSLHSKMHPQSEVKINKLILPPEITWCSLKVDGSDNTYEDVFKKGKYFRYDQKGCFTFFTDLDGALNKYIDNDRFNTDSEFQMWLNWSLRRDSFRNGLLGIYPPRINGVNIGYIFDNFYYKGE